MPEMSIEDMDIPDRVEYQPLPAIYEAFAAGTSPYVAVTEVIDNAIDYVRVQGEDGDAPDELVVEISFESGEEGESGKLVIEDNSGGVQPSELRRFFQLGRTVTPEHGIGRFGVGAKRLIAIGQKIKYQSRAQGNPVGVGFEVNRQDLEDNRDSVDDDVYQSSTEVVDDLDEGHTRIVVTDLNQGVYSRLFERRNETDSPEMSLWRLGETYEHFLKEGISIDAFADSGDIGFQILLSDDDELDEEEVRLPEEVELCYLPFDGLSPRTYKNLPFSESNEVDVSDDPTEDPDEVLRVDITAGLMTSNDREKAGLTVTMNNRVILFRDTDNDLFTSRHLKNFNSARGHGRVYCELSIRGASDELPWNDYKDGFNPAKDVTDEILGVVGNALEEYMAQTYDKLPSWMLSAYPPSPDDTPLEIDKSGSKVNNPRFNRKPGESNRGRSYRNYPQRDRIRKLVKLHSALRVFAPQKAEDQELPAYETFFELEYPHIGDTSEYTPEEPVELNEPEAGLDLEELVVPLDDDDDRPIPIIYWLKNLAEGHVEDKNLIDETTEGFENWKLPRYSEEHQKARGGSDMSGFSVLEEYSDTFSSVDQSTLGIETEETEEQGGSPEDESAGTAAGAGVTTSPQSPSTDTGSVNAGQDDGIPKNEGRAPPTSASREESTATAPSRQDSSGSGSVQRDLPVADTGPTAEQARSGFDHGLVIGSDAYELSDDDREALFGYLAVDEDASPETIFEALLEALEEREELKEENDRLEARVQEIEETLSEINIDALSELLHIEQ